MIGMIGLLPIQYSSNNFWTSNKQYTKQFVTIWTILRNGTFQVKSDMAAVGATFEKLGILLIPTSSSNGIRETT